MKFKLFLVYHSHIDVGYTERQEKIARYQGDFIKQAVNFALDDKQSNRNQDNTFKFTAEGFWAVEQYLKNYGKEGAEKLVSAAKTGNFELTAGYFHMAELLNYENLVHSLSYCKDFCLNNGLATPEVAMSADVNGFSWGFADALIDNGVKYLSTNINTHHGGAPFSKPNVPFYWQAPSGRKLLVWSGLAYHKANLLGLIPGLAPADDPGIPGMIVEKTGFENVTDTTYAHKRITALVESLKRNNYKYDFLPIMGSGLYTDNSPVGDEHCELIDMWNKQYGDEIEIQTVTLKEFFHYLEQHAQDIPTYAGDWNDWWTDGVACTPNETKIFRNAQRNMCLIEKLDPDCAVVDETQREKIRNKLIMYAEHTWGHSASHSDPCKLLVNQLDARKAKLAFDADVEVGKALDKLSLALGEGEFTHRRPFEYVIVNPLDTVATKEVLLPTDFWEEGWFTNGQFAVYDNGQKIPVQRTSTLRGSFIACVVTLQPKERRTLTIRIGETPCNETISDYKYFRLFHDDNGIAEIHYNGEEIFNRKDGQLCLPVYEVFPNGIRQKAAGFGYSARTIPQSVITEGRLIDFKVAEDGNIFTKFVYNYNIEGSKRTSVAVYVYKSLPRIEITGEFAKDLEIDPEGMYLKFNISAKGEWYLDKAGAFFKPGQQLPETCCDYYSVQKGVALVGDNSTVTVNCFDAPLVTFNKIKLWNYSTTAENTGALFSWITNNKWETNFRTECAGFLESRYRLAFGNNAQQQLEENEYDFLVLRK